MDSLINFFAICMVITSILTLGENSLVRYIRYYWAQSISLACLGLVVATGIQGYITAALILIVNGALLPIWLTRLLKKQELQMEDEPAERFPLLMVAGLLLWSLAYYIIHPLAEASITSLVMANSLSLIFIGIFITTVKKMAFGQMMGLLVMGNGGLLGSIALTQGSSLILDIGILLALLGTTFVMGNLTQSKEDTFHDKTFKKLTELRG
jgi:hydrogenase-4 membrane subunit HyfE